jgi:hypothetical protein
MVVVEEKIAKFCQGFTCKWLIRRKRTRKEEEEDKLYWRSQIPLEHNTLLTEGQRPHNNAGKTTR